MNEKFNKNAKVEKFTTMLGIAVRLIVIDPVHLCDFGARTLSNWGGGDKHCAIILSIIWYRSVVTCSGVISIFTTQFCPLRKEIYTNNEIENTINNSM